MLMPVLLPVEFLDCRRVSSDAELLNLLKKKPSDLISFFEFACEDEDWSDLHLAFMTEAISWITLQFFSGNLAPRLAKRAAIAIQKKISYFEHLLPKNVTIVLADGKFVINSLLFQTASPFFDELIRSNCFEKGQKKLNYPEVRSLEFKTIQAYLYTHEVKMLWSLSEQELVSVLKFSRRCQLSELTQESERLLVCYVELSRLEEFLSLAEEENLSLIAEVCCKMMNTLHNDLFFSCSINPKKNSCQLSRSTEVTREFIERFSKFINHFIGEKSVMEDSELIPVLNRCPNLRSFHLGSIYAYTDLILQIQKVEELILSGSSWLRDTHLKQMISCFPKLKKLHLMGCNDLTFDVWGELLKLSELILLDLSQCDAIRDVDLALILASARQLRNLNLEECRSLTSLGFYHLSKSSAPIENLNLARTAIDDKSLFEVISKMKNLKVLHLTRCRKLSEKGVYDALKSSYSLEEVNLIATGISNSFAGRIHTLKPQLRILLEEERPGLIS